MATLTRMRIKPEVLVLALVAASLPLLAWQQTGTTVRHHTVAEQEDDPSSAATGQAEAAMQKQDFATAEALLQKTVATYPNAYRAWFDLGYLYTQTKRTSDAIDAYRKSIAAKPDVFESNLNLGIVLARQGDKEEAAKYLKAATQLTPTAHVDEGRARAWLSLGLVEEANDPQQALAAYAQAAELTPKDAEPHLSAGLLLEKQDKLDEAAREYQLATECDPKATEPLAGLANVYTKQKKYAEAEAQLRKLLAIDPSNGNAQAQLGRLLSAEGKGDEAAKTMSSAGAASNGPRAALDLGTTYVNAGNYSAAEEQFRIAMQGLPNDAEVHYALGSVLMEEKRIRNHRKNYWQP